MYVCTLLTQITVKCVAYGLTQRHPTQHAQESGVVALQNACRRADRDAWRARGADRETVARAVATPRSGTSQLARVYWIRDCRRGRPGGRPRVGRGIVHRGCRTFGTPPRVRDTVTMATREITFEEFCKHNKEDDLWLLIDGKGKW